MEENRSHGQLTSKQVQLLSLLLAGVNIVAAAKQCQVAETTAHRWLKQETFKAAYKQANDDLFEQALDELKLGMSDAIAGLRKHLSADVEPTAATHLAAVRFWIEQGLDIHKMGELTERIAELEKLLTKEGQGNNGNIRRVK